MDGTNGDVCVGGGATRGSMGGSNDDVCVGGGGLLEDI